MVFLRFRVFFLLALCLLGTPSWAKNAIIADSRDFTRPEVVERINSIFFAARLNHPIKAPRTSFIDHEGKELSFRDFRGKLLVVPLWATWCMDCLAELRSMENLRADLEYDDLYDIAIVPISVDFKQPAEVQEIYEAHKLQNLPLLFDQKRVLMETLHANSLPATFLINESGYIIAYFDMHLPWDAPAVRDNLLALASSTSATLKQKPNKTAQDTIVWQSPKNSQNPQAIDKLADEKAVSKLSDEPEHQIQELPWHNPQTSRQPVETQ